MGVVKLTEPIKQHSGWIIAMWGWIVSQCQWLAAHWPTLNDWVLFVTMGAGILSGLVSLQKFCNERTLFKINKKKVKK